MTLKQHKRLFWIAAAVLSVLHLDVFNHGGSAPLLFGWLPRDLAYHIAWVLVAGVLVLHLTLAIWRRPE